VNLVGRSLKAHRIRGYDTFREVIPGGAPYILYV